MNILIIDDHMLFVEGLRCLLASMEKNVQIHSASDDESALKYISKNGCPDLILLDFHLSNVNEKNLLKSFKELDVSSPVLMVSSAEVPSATGVALAQGASGFISKFSSYSVLLLAIKTVLGGDIYIPSDDSSKKSYTPIVVTTRQQEILYLLSQGMLNKQIAHELSISANTVKAHLHQIFRVLKVNNRTAAVQHAYEKGLL